MGPQTVSRWGEPIIGVLDTAMLARELEVELSRSRRYEYPFALLRLKLIDCAGQAPPEALLQRLCGAVRLVVRWSDSVARETDSQYLILLRETDAKGARTAADKLVSAVRKELAHDADHLRFQCRTAAWRKGDHLGALLARLDPETAE